MRHDPLRLTRHDPPSLSNRKQSKQQSLRRDLSMIHQGPLGYPEAEFLRLPVLQVLREPVRFQRQTIEGKKHYPLKWWPHPWNIKGYHQGPGRDNMSYQRGWRDSLMLSTHWKAFQRIPEREQLSQVLQKGWTIGMGWANISHLTLVRFLHLTCLCQCIHMTQKENARGARVGFLESGT